MNLLFVGFLYGCAVGAGTVLIIDMLREYLTYLEKKKRLRRFIKGESPDQGKIYLKLLCYIRDRIPTVKAIPAGVLIPEEVFEIRGVAE